MSLAETAEVVEPVAASEPETTEVKKVEFDPYKKEIFTYTRNGQDISVDPIVIYRKFKQAVRDSGELNSNAEDDDSGKTGMEILFSNAFMPLVDKDGKPLMSEERADALWDNIIDPARNVIANAIRTAFGYTEVKPDGSGMSERDAIELFEAFWKMEEDVKKNTNPMPT